MKRLIKHIAIRLWWFSRQFKNVYYEEKTN